MNTRFAQAWGRRGRWRAPMLAVAWLAAGVLAAAAASGVEPNAANGTLATLQAGWQAPARTYRPHTRWWWPGNALTKADITWQLEQMAAQGIGGVEIMSAAPKYPKGNHDYLSPEFLELVRHAVAEGKRLDMDVALTFGPGWSFGGAWVSPEDQSQALTIATAEATGGTAFNAPVPAPRPGRLAHGRTDPGRLIAVVAGRLNERAQLDAASLTVLSPSLAAGTSRLDWQVPAGRWRVMAFWLQRTGQQNQQQSGGPPAMVIDHLNQGAVQRYCDYLGGIFARAFGDEFGRTVDSFFCDSFEIIPVPNGLLWSTDTLARFQEQMGYDFTRYLPAIWYDIGPTTPRVRYDLGKFLSDLGLRTVFKTFDDWCAAHHVQARVQPHYRFTEELEQGAGAVARPETEVTTTRFEPVPDPRKATVSGARFYGREFVSAEAYTFIHPGRYRTTLQDMKIATDAFLRDGVTQFYNHGYFGSPEPHVAPSRDMPWASRISHWNTWWPYYHHLAGYVARSSFLLRQGRFVADVLVYSPQATAWSERALWGADRRVLPYGDLAKTLVANGYDFDLVNDDLLQHHATFRHGAVEINGYAYRVLVLPRATVLPIETARALRSFAQAGGMIVALDTLPQSSAGTANADRNDRELQQIVTDLFAPGAASVFVPDYKVSPTPFVPTKQVPPQPTPPLTDAQRQALAAIGRRAPPDLALPGNAQSDGLTFLHKRVGDIDVYFVTNLEPKPIDAEVTFHVGGKTPQRWNAVTGATGGRVRGARAAGEGTVVPLQLAAWESTFLLFTPGALPPVAPPRALTLPAPIPVTGRWRLKLEADGFEPFATETADLRSWTDEARTRYFSGTGRYEIEFNLPVDPQAQPARMILDLGQVGDIADVELNDHRVGVAWLAPYRLDITDYARRGPNRLVVRVTNQLVNSVAGLRSPPDVPVDLQPRLGKSDPSAYLHSALAREDLGNPDLPPSGLLGPVRIVWQPEMN